MKLAVSTIVCIAASEAAESAFSKSTIRAADAQSSVRLPRAVSQARQTPLCVTDSGSVNGDTP